MRASNWNHGDSEVAFRGCHFYGMEGDGENGVRYLLSFVLSDVKHGVVVDSRLKVDVFM